MTTETPYEIPLVAGAQSLQITLGNIEYTLNVYWLEAANCWCVDILDVTGTIDIVTGIPLVTGADLLEQYGYMNFGGLLIAQIDGDIYTPPSYDSLGSTGHLYFIVE